MHWSAFGPNLFSRLRRHWSGKTASFGRSRQRFGQGFGQSFFPPDRAILDDMATKRPPSERRFEVAISSGDIKLVERLIAQGASVHGTRTHDFPAMWAIENGQAEILKVLIRHGVDPRSGDGVLFLTGIYHDQQAILKLLLSLVFSLDLLRGKSL